MKSQKWNKWADEITTKMFNELKEYVNKQLNESINMIVNETEENANKLNDWRKTVQDMTDHTSKELEIMKGNQAWILEMKNSVERFGSTHY